MAAQAGKTVVVSIMNDATPTPAYVAIAGLRSRGMKLGQETVDITTAESTGLWRELLGETAGVRSASISGSGIAKNDAGMTVLQDCFFDGTIRDMKFFLPGFGTFAGPFQITEFSLDAEHTGAASFSATFESAGAVTFTAA